MEHPGQPSSPNTHDPLDQVQEHMRSEESQEDLERKERIEYLRSIAGPRKKPKRKWWKWLIAVIALAAVLSGAGYWFLTKSDGATDNKSKQTTDNTPAESQSIDGNKNAAIVTKQHQSSAFNLQFDYPDDWTIADDGTGILTAKSPTMQLKGASGKTVSGQIVITIQGKQNELKDFKTGNGLAVRESEKIAYTKPTASQRAQTYLSFVSYAGSATPGIEGMYVTGDIGYQKDQAVPMVDIVRVDPLIVVSFTGAGASGMSLSPDNWKDGNLFTKSIKTVLTSLSIQ